MIFISHAAQDTPYAEELAAELKLHGFDAWTDRNLLPGDNWAREIDRALREADVMVALVSPAAAQSEWVQREWQYALGREKLEGRLIPVLLGRTEISAAPWIFDTLFPLRNPTPSQVARRVKEVMEGRGNRAKAGSRASS